MLQKYKYCQQFEKQLELQNDEIMKNLIKQNIKIIMDNEIFIKQPIDDEKVDLSEQQYSQMQNNEESLEHLVNSLIQNQQPNDDDQFKQQIGKRRINDQRFTYQEDRKILELVQQVGPNFNKIVKQFPGKTMNMIKNRYYKKLRYIKDDLQNEQEISKKHSKTKKVN